MDEATRGILTGITDVERTAFFALAYSSLAVCAGGIALRMWYWARGRAAPRFGSRGLASRAKKALVQVFLQPRLRVASAAGWIHLAIFWGFLILFVGTELIAVAMHAPLTFFDGVFYLLFSLATDLFGLLLLAGVVFAGYRRCVVRPLRSRGAAHGPALLLLGLLAVSGFLLEGLRIAFTADAWAGWSPVGRVVALLVSGRADPAELALWHHRVWWIHAVIACTFIGALPFGLLRHALVAPLHWLLQDSRPAGALTTPFRLERIESGATARIPPTLGADFAWTQLMALDACTECGLCDQSCPALAAGRPLSPKRVVVGLREQLNRWRTAATTPLHRLIEEDAAWSCTTCGACMEVCPVGIRHTDYLVDARRAALTKGRAKADMGRALENLQRCGNPYGMDEDRRLAWAANLPLTARVTTLADAGDFDVLYWIGCAGAFDERGQRVARAVVELLGRAGVRFAVLGPEERCTGDPARRLGEEGLFQHCARVNIATLEAHQVKKILTHCPHCFHIFKNEYPVFGGHYAVVHHAEFLAQLVATGRLQVTARSQDAPITFHDPCHLGRYNRIVDAPRAVLRAALGAAPREMPASGVAGQCCGAGGGHAWFDLGQGGKMNAARYTQAAATGAGTVATACQFCALMFEEIGSARDVHERLRVRDIAEILNEAASP